MSTVTTFLTLVWDYAEDNAVWGIDLLEVNLLEDGEQALAEVRDLGIRVGEPHEETHILFPLHAPLTPQQLQGLTELKEAGYFSNFYMRDEISHDNH